MLTISGTIKKVWYGSQKGTLPINFTVTDSDSTNAVLFKGTIWSLDNNDMVHLIKAGDEITITGPVKKVSKYQDYIYTIEVWVEEILSYTALNKEPITKTEKIKRADEEDATSLRTAKGKPSSGKGE